MYVHLEYNKLYCTVLYCTLPTNITEYSVSVSPGSNLGSNTKCSNITLNLTKFLQ